MIESDIEKSSFCPLKLYLKYLDAEKMGAWVIKSELYTLNGP